MKSLLVLLLALCATFGENIQEFTDANNQFTAAIFKHLSRFQNENFLVSPFSAETILSFAQSGCKGKTAEELRDALHLPDDKSKVESAVRAILPKLKGNKLFTLHTANKLYIKTDFPIKDDFKTTASQIYQADIEPIDFTKNVKAAEKINRWVQSHTNKKITNLIDPQDLDHNTRAVLINALYFKGNWLDPFPVAATRKDKFYKTATKVIEVDFMHKYDTYFNYYECPHLKAKFLELPFKADNKDVSLVVVLPNEKEGLASLQSQLNSVFIPIHKFQTTYMNVALPKFHIESLLNFKEVLLDLGVVKAFDKNQADLSGIAGEKGDLIISKVVQKTFIDVTEQSVEAAAATSIIVPIVSPLPESSTPFIANHPFIFYIKLKDLVIFAGRVTEPKF